MTWWSKALCFVGVHDWRNMDGVCCECHYIDPIWHEKKKWCCFTPEGWMVRVTADRRRQDYGPYRHKWQAWWKYWRV